MISMITISKIYKVRKPIKARSNDAPPPPSANQTNVGGHGDQHSFSVPPM